MAYQTKSIYGPIITYDATNTVLNDGGIFRVRDIEPDIPFKRPYSALFYKFLTAAPEGPLATQDIVYFGEQEKYMNFVTVLASASSSVDHIEVTNAYNCVPGDKLINSRTKEIIRVIAIGSATSLTLTATTGYGRAFGGTTAAAMKMGDRLYKMGNALTERGRTPSTNVKMPTPMSNYCSFYVAAVATVKAQENSHMLGNFGAMNEQMANMMFAFREQKNADLWFGRKSLTVVASTTAHDLGGGNLYQMDGFDAQVRTHAFDFSGIGHITWELWNETLSPAFDNDSGDRFLYCGKNVYSSLINTARANVHPTEYKSSIEGVMVDVINVDGGTVHLIRDYDGLPPGSARLVHPGFVEYREREGYGEQWIMNTKLPTQIQDNVNTLVSGGTLVVRNEETMAKIDNVFGPFTRGLVADITM